MTTYAEQNPRTKKELKDLVASGAQLRAFTMTPFGTETPRPGRVALSGPHYPEPHRWYATVEVDAAGFITKVVA